MNREYRKRIEQTLNFISENIQRELSLEEISEKANFSKFHFHRIFKAMTGETVFSYIRRTRLEKAAAMILTDFDKSITDVAMDCGFGSSQSFATSFKKRYGCSPTDFRESESLSEFKSNLKNSNDSLIERTSEDYSDSQKNLWINIIDMPAFHVAFHRVKGPYGVEATSEAFETLFKWAYKKIEIDKRITLGIVWDNPEVTQSSLCRYDACITVPEDIKTKGSIKKQIIKGGIHVVGHCEVKKYEEIERVYEKIFSSWLPESNYIPLDSFAYEIYLNNPESHPRGKMLVDICIPVEKIYSNS